MLSMATEKIVKNSVSESLNANGMIPNPTAEATKKPRKFGLPKKIKLIPMPAIVTQLQQQIVISSVFNCNFILKATLVDTWTQRHRNKRQPSCLTVLVAAAQELEPQRPPPCRILYILPRRLWSKLLQELRR